MPNNTLISKAKSILADLDLQKLKSLNVLRNQNSYFLNISYPSLQAMKALSENEILEISNIKPTSSTLALYIHLPFCQALCSYCHYYKIFKATPNTVANYIDHIIREISLRKSSLENCYVESIYIGGGTPSYCLPQEITRLFDAIKSNLKINDDAEISFEVHPEHASQQLFSALKSNGVNRISIGVESLTDNILLTQNRRHTAAQAVAAYNLAGESGFDNVNLDLIYGLPTQSLTDWLDSLEKVTQLRPASVCAYYMRLKQGTPDFKKYSRKMADEEDRLLMHILTFEALGEKGYKQNRVDWFVKDDIFNHSYQQANWQKTDQSGLLGIGASSYSYMNGWQYYNVNNINKYQESIAKGVLPIWKGEKLTTLEEMMRRSIFLGIKTPISRSWFRSIYRRDPVDSFPDIWERLVDAGLVSIEEDVLSLTYQGKLFADEIGQLFYSNSMKNRMQQVESTLVSTTQPKQNPPSK